MGNGQWAMAGGVTGGNGRGWRRDQAVTFVFGAGGDSILQISIQIALLVYGRVKGDNLGSNGDSERGIREASGRVPVGNPRMR